MRDNIPRRKDTFEIFENKDTFRGQALKNVVFIKILDGIFQILTILDTKHFPSKPNIFLIGRGLPPLSHWGKRLLCLTDNGLYGFYFRIDSSRSHMILWEQLPF